MKPAPPVIRYRMRSSPASAPEEHDWNGAEHDPQVLERRLAADVCEIARQLPPHVVDRTIVALVDLRPAGDAGAHPLTALVALDLLTQVHEEGRLLGAGGGDDHVAPQHLANTQAHIQTE